MNCLVLSLFEAYFTWNSLKLNYIKAWDTLLKHILWQSKILKQNLRIINGLAKEKPIPNRLIRFHRYISVIIWIKQEMVIYVELNSDLLDIYWARLWIKPLLHWIKWTSLSFLSPQLYKTYKIGSAKANRKSWMKFWKGEGNY